MELQDAGLCSSRKWRGRTRPETDPRGGRGPSRVHLQGPGQWVPRLTQAAGIGLHPSPSPFSTAAQMLPCSFPHRTFLTQRGKCHRPEMLLYRYFTATATVISLPEIMPLSSLALQCMCTACSPGVPMATGTPSQSLQLQGHLPESGPWPKTLHSGHPPQCPLCTPSFSWGLFSHIAGTVPPLPQQHMK